MCNINEHLLHRRGKCEHHYEENGDVYFDEKDIIFSMAGLRLHQECYRKFMGGTLG